MARIPVFVYDLTDEPNSPPVTNFSPSESPILGDLIKYEDKEGGWHRLVVFERCWEVDRTHGEILNVYCKVHQ